MFESPFKEADEVQKTSWLPDLISLAVQVELVQRVRRTKSRAEIMFLRSTILSQSRDDGKAPRTGIW